MKCIKLTFRFLILCCLFGCTSLSYSQPHECDFRAPGARDASWAPDSSKLIFDANHEGDRELYVMNPDGTEIKRLTHTAASEYYPFYSPDGKKVVFLAIADENEIHVMHADGSNMKRLGEPGQENADPHWSPDGEHIAFYSDRDGNSEIYAMDADGGNHRRLTHSPTSETTPSWSPDGSQIAFISNRDGNAEVYVMDADGSNQRRVTTSPLSDRVARWAPDGMQLIFYSRTSTRGAASRAARDVSWAGAEIYTIKVDGTNRTKLTENNHLDQSPVLSPDGTRISFTSCRSGNREVYVMDADGKNAKRLTFSGRDRR